MKVLYDLLIGDTRTLAGVLASLLLAYGAVRLGQPELAGLVLLLGVMATLAGVTWLKARR